MGYHLREIPRGDYGEADKILEEAVEFADAIEQGVDVMALVELADLYGAIKGYLEKYHPSIDMDSLSKMTEVTARAFLDGTRSPRNQISIPPDYPSIQWTLLNDALQFYTSKGFDYCEVPWTVPGGVTHVTLPEQKHGITTLYGDLVGSAEQSFIQKRCDGALPDGDYCALTPCFRTEPSFDHLRRPYFMKLELIRIGQSSVFTVDDVHSLAILCKAWMEEISKSPIELVETNEGFDLELNGIEVGSYGVQGFQDFSWVYGTGIAEPRFSQAQR